MKKFLSILFIFAIFSSFCGCSNEKEEYVLSNIVIDNEPISNVSGYLTLKKDKTGNISINNNSSVIYWSDNPFDIKINDLIAHAEKTQTGLVLSLDNGSVIMNYSIGPAVEGYQDNSTISGTRYEGRFYFSDCEGEWIDYNGRSMYVFGELTDTKISLFNDYYSKNIPMIDLTIEGDHSISGYVMAYPMKEYDVRIESDKQNKKDVNNTEFLHPEEYIWNKYLDEEETIEPEELVDVITLTGSGRNASGGFSYKVVLTEENNESHKE